MNIDRLNAAERAEFTAALGGVFEHSPWIAERAWARRPFTDLDALHRALCDVLAAATRTEQLALIRAHPELGGREAAAGTLTADSAGEQRSAGLQHCSAAEFARLRELNAAYRARFGFPFVMAVKGRARAEILAALAARLEHEREAEFRTALAEIGRIARLRLDALFAGD